MKYKNIQLKDVADIVMGQSPKSVFYNTNGNGIPFLQGVRTFGENYPQIDTWTTSYNRKAKSGEILFSVRAPVGRVNWANQDLAVGRGLAALKIKSGYSKEYLYYLFKKIGGQLDSLATGTVFTSINKKELEALELKIPVNLSDQEKIADYLQKFDQEIELNNQINDNLLDFLDTEFSHQFLGERNFPSGKVKDFVNIKRGASPRPIKDFLSENGRSWVKISDVTKLTTPFLYRTEQYIKKSGIKKSRTIKPGTLILSNSATPGIPVISEILASVHDGWLIIDNYSLMNRNWFYLFFRQMRNSLVAQANGSVFNNLKTNIVKEFPVPIVDKSELTKFHKISNPIFEKLNQIQQENIELNRIKQTLLSQYF